MYQLWKALHVISLFMAFAFFQAPALMSFRAIRARDGAALRQAAQAEIVFGRLGIGSLAIGVGLGIATVLTGGLSFFEPWLVTAYVLLATIIATATGLIQPRVRRVAEASGTEESLSTEALRWAVDCPACCWFPRSFSCS